MYKPTYCLFDFRFLLIVGVLLAIVSPVPAWAQDSVRPGVDRMALEKKMRPEQLSKAGKMAAPGPAGAPKFHPAQWAEGSTRKSGATRDYFDLGAHLKWRKRRGDWYDANAALYGNAAYSTALIKDLDREQTVIWDVTTLVRGWRNAEYPNTGVFLKTLANQSAGTIEFHSREHRDKSKSPIIRISYSGDRGRDLTPTADTFFKPFTNKPQGKNKFLNVSRRQSTLIRFDSDDLRDLGPFVKAELVLRTTAEQRGAAVIGVFRPAPELAAAPHAATVGIAERYPRDKGIMADKEVIFVENFESRSWAKSWSVIRKSETSGLVAEDAARKFVPLSGMALKVVIQRGENLGLNLRYKFAKETGREPEAAYFRYYLRLSPNWRPTVDGGKLPGFAGTYGIAGWGGRRSNGQNGWSTRGMFRLMVPKGSPLQGRIPIGTYAYHADMRGKFGDAWMWTNGGLGTLETNKWYCIEQYVRLNRVGFRDGILKTWVDGRLAFERKRMRYRTSSGLKIEEVWMNVYHGGTKPAPRDFTLFIDNIVIARGYIGPIKR